MMCFLFVTLSTLCRAICYLLIVKYCCIIPFKMNANTKEKYDTANTKEKYDTETKSFETFSLQYISYIYNTDILLDHSCDPDVNFFNKKIQS